MTMGTTTRIAFAEDVAAPARDDEEAAVRDVAFEEALARVRAGRRALARRAAERATRRGISSRS